MATIATATITLSSYRDTLSVTRYYALVSSTASVPNKPTAYPPPVLSSPAVGWSITEPDYTSGSTNTLYFTDVTIFSNGEFLYSDVSKSSSYEAAKEAWNKANAAQTTAEEGFDEACEIITENVGTLSDSITINIENSITDVTNYISTEISRVNGDIIELSSKSLIGLGYATVESDSLVIKNGAENPKNFVSILPDAIRLVNSIGNNYVEITSNSIGLKADDIFVANIYKNELNEGILEVSNVSISTLKMRSVNGEGNFAWVAQRNGHLSLKEVL